MRRATLTAQGSVPYSNCPLGDPTGAGGRRVCATVCATCCPCACSSLQRQTRGGRRSRLQVVVSDNGCALWSHGGLATQQGHTAGYLRRNCRRAQTSPQMGTQAGGLLSSAWITKRFKSLWKWQPSPAARHAPASLAERAHNERQMLRQRGGRQYGLHRLQQRKAAAERGQHLRMYSQGHGGTRRCVVACGLCQVLRQLVVQVP
jgi:hypothetical protein